MNFDFPTKPLISIRKRRKPGININEFKKIKLECEEIKSESTEIKSESTEIKSESTEIKSESTEIKSEEYKEFEKESEEFELYCNETLPPLCHCIICYEYMGETNPRQYCNKSYCLYDGYEKNELSLIQMYNLEASPYYNDPVFIHYPEYHDKIQSFIDKF